MDASLANVYSYVKQERANVNQQLILLDNGDILQGQPPVYFSNFIDDTKQNLISRVFNFMKYDATTIGITILKQVQKFTAQSKNSLKCR